MHTTILTLLALAASVRSHTWIEQLNVIDATGFFTGAPGFARGNVDRQTPGFNDGLMTNLIPPNGRATGNEILSTDPMCKSNQQQPVQGDGARLQAPAGSAIALRYQENGHVTLPQNQPGKPANRGTVFVYGTTQPSSSDTLLAIHKVWNAEGTGGDQRGVLLSSQNFDDGRCGQLNDGNISLSRNTTFYHTPDALMGANMWCQQDIALPTSAPTGQPYTLYWVWDWPTAVGTPGQPDGLNETYTSCMDIDIVDGQASFNMSLDESLGLSCGQFDPTEICNITNNIAIPSEVVELSNPTAVPDAPKPIAGESVAAAPAPSSPGLASTPSGVPPQATAPQPGQQGGHGSGGNPFTPSTFATVTQSNAAATIAPIPVATITSANAGSGSGPLTATVTEYDSIIETVFQTIYPTGGFKIRGKRH